MTDEPVRTAHPPVTSRTSWQAELDRLLAREKAHTRKQTPSRRPAGGCRWSRWTPRSRWPASTGRFRSLTYSRAGGS
jgi:hypothetical protein